MKKILLFILFFIVFCTLAFVFVQFKKKPETASEKKEEWKLENVDEVKIMSVQGNNTFRTDICSAFLISKIRSGGSLPLDARFIFTNDEPHQNIDSIRCRITYKNITIEETLKNIGMLDDKKSPVKTSGFILTDLSKLKNTISEKEILDFINVFPSAPEIKYFIKPIYAGGQPESDWIALSIERNR